MQIYIFHHVFESNNSVNAIPMDNEADAKTYIYIFTYNIHIYICIYICIYEHINDDNYCKIINYNLYIVIVI